MKKMQIEHFLTHFSHYGRLVNVFAVDPPVHTALQLDVAEVDVLVRNKTTSGEIPDHIQSVSAALAQLLFSIHLLTVTMTTA